MSHPAKMEQGWADWQNARTPHITAAIASQLVSRAICVRPWPDSGFPRAFSLWSRRVGYPACWFTPPRFRSRRSGSPNAGSLRVNSRSAVHRADGRHCGPTNHNHGLPRFLAAERRLLCRVTEERHREGASPFQSFGQFLNPKYGDVHSVKLYNCFRPGGSQMSFSFSSCLSPFVFLFPVEFLPRMLKRCHNLFARDL